MRFWHLVLGLGGILFLVAGVRAQEGAWLEMISPERGARLVARRPEIRFRILVPFERDSLLVLLDDTDITPVLKLEEGEVSFRPFRVLPPGEHRLVVSLRDIRGQPLEETVLFYTRHTRPFEEARVDNELSAYYRFTVRKPDSPPDEPDSRVEANLSSEARLRDGPWSTGLRTELRFVDQNTPLSPPQEKGLDLTHWLFTGAYEKDALRFRAEIGDVQISETPYTVSALARRGGYFRFGFGDYALRFFSVKSAQVFGLKGGTGIGTETEDHILGVAGEARFFNGKFRLTTVYAGGEEPGESFGVFAGAGGTRGEVFGVLVSTPLSEKLEAEAEADFSRYDPDTSDEFGKESGAAYRAGFRGMWGAYRYEAAYEYFGRDYAVVGQAPPRDRAGFRIRGGASRGVHDLQLEVSRYHDNVEKDPLFPRTYSTDLGLTYTCNRFRRLPLGLSYQKNIQDSRDEPEGTPPLKMHTDTLSAQATLLLGRLNLAFSGSFSFMNDRTPEDRDTANLVLTLAPSYGGEGFSLSPSLSYNESRDLASGVKTRTYTLTLDVRKDFLAGRGNLALSGAYNLVRADDDSVDNRNLDLNLNLSYSLKPLFQDSLRSTLQLQGRYRRNEDRVYDHSDEEYGIYLILTVNWSFSL
ncbi:hypothetical protein [Thermosulfurimonas sp. F29]|uniref:hypothetical protein n=1 Tax=Thermosulfurimonas sp. F29 TaxID=2867247 RepID=UPI001C83E6FB|nr:hypothetical protein [Thermosulfurimonas sp. F29]MBX6423522.1 hypothetical protein [Thermosulfurimonas sp. F29]